MARIRRIVTVVLIGAAVPVLIGGSAVGQAPPAAPPPMPRILRDYPPVTSARLLKPEDGDWLATRRTYDGWGYSPLREITPANVGRLRPVWVFSTGEARPHESAPIVNGGVMFVTSPNGQVIAIDVRTGTLLWRYRRPRPSAAVF
jgi:alcohol dehydrogenase (cytochrome c)